MKEPSMPHVEVDLVKGAKRHGRRSGAHERDQDHVQVGFGPEVDCARFRPKKEINCDFF